jgi:hypothetical protein
MKVTGDGPISFPSILLLVTKPWVADLLLVWAAFRGKGTRSCFSRDRNMGGPFEFAPDFAKVHVGSNSNQQLLRQSSFWNYQHCEIGACRSELISARLNVFAYFKGDCRFTSVTHRDWNDLIKPCRFLHD